MKQKNYNLRLSEPLIRIVDDYKKRNHCETESEALRRIIAEYDSNYNADRPKWTDSAVQK